MTNLWNGDAGEVLTSGCVTLWEATSSLFTICAPRERASFLTWRWEAVELCGSNYCLWVWRISRMQPFRALAFVSKNGDLFTSMPTLWWWWWLWHNHDVTASGACMNYEVTQFFFFSRDLILSAVTTENIYCCQRRACGYAEATSFSLSTPWEQFTPLQWYR